MVKNWLMVSKNLIANSSNGICHALLLLNVQILDLRTSNLQNIRASHLIIYREKL